MKSFYANKVCSTDKVPTAARLAPEEFFFIIIQLKNLSLARLIPLIHATYYCDERLVLLLLFWFPI